MDRLITYDFAMNQANNSRLRTIKLIHTLVWLFFNVVIFYMLYAVLVNKLDRWLWIGFTLVLLEGLTLIIFRWTCPLTVLARKYSDSTNDNFDIYLPNWLAKHTKLIYTSLVVFILIMAIIRISTTK